MRETVDESSQHRLVIKIQVWYRWDYMLGIPGLLLMGLVFVYAALHSFTWWKWVFYFMSVWMFGGGGVLAFDSLEDIVWVFDKTRGTQPCRVSGGRRVTD